MNEITIQKKQMDSVNSILKQFKEMDANVVGNETYLNAPPPVGFIHAYEVVNICKDPAFKEVYPQKGGGLSLTAVALKKLGKAMGIKFAPGQVVQRTYDSEDNTKTIIFRSIACCRGLDSQFSWSTMDYEFDLTKRRDEIENTQRKNIKKYQAQPGTAPPEFKVCKTEKEIAEWFKEVVRVEMIQIEKNALTRAQTGSMTRCIRDLGAFPSTYMPQQLDKPFLIPKLVVYYDPVNPLDRAFALEQTKAPMMMFPPEPQRIQPQIGVAQPLPPQLQAIEVQAPPPEEIRNDRKLSEPIMGETVSKFYLPPDEEKEEMEKMLDPDYTETEVQMQNEMQLSPIESTILDYDACDPGDKIHCVEQTLKQKKWAGKLNKTLDKFTPAELKNFYMMLVKLPNPEQAQTNLPWEDYQG